MLETDYLTEQEAVLLNPLQLAYLGDAIWEMMVREHHFPNCIPQIGKQLDLKP